MTLSQLLRGCTIQSNVRLALVNGDGDEEMVFTFVGLEHSGEIIDAAKELKLMSAKVTYLFAPGDGYLHIEIVRGTR